MNISLTKPLESFVQEKVDSGMYASASEVIRAGLRLLSEHDLDSKLRQGIDQADAGLGTELDEVFAEKLIKKVQQRVLHDSK